MKKIFLLILFILLLSGCTSNVNYNFKKDIVESTIDFDFTIDEYFEKVNDEDISSNMNNKDKEEALLNDKDSIKLNAFIDNDIEYSLVKFDNNNYKYSGLYKYDYDYTNIKRNYLFNCFENYKYSEDENYYNFELSGNYTCNTDIKLNISSEFGIDNSNSIEIKNGVHSFDIYEENNRIVFSIRKHRFNNENTVYGIRVIAFIVIVIMLIITFGSYKIVKKNTY